MYYSDGLLVAAALSLSVGIAQAGPTGGQVTGGIGTITQSGSTTTIQQSSQNLSLNWQTFNIAPRETVDFVQPNATSIAVNRILDPNGSVILGHLNANGQVYLINPNGVLFGKGAEVNVGALVASTLDLTNSPLGDSTKTFSGTGSGSIVNDGTLNATGGGAIALLGNHVSNTGVISAQLGTVALGAGSAATLTFHGNNLVGMQVDQSVLNSVASNGGLIRADGGQVLMTAGAQKALLASVVNNTGIIEARTLDNHDGTITLLGGASAGTVNVGGTLDASAPTDGNGGFIDTSAAHVEVATTAKITTEAVSGKTGNWLIDPQDFTVAASGGDMTGATLTTELASNNVQIQSSQGATAGTGDININDVVSWNAHALTLTAANNVNVNAVMTASGAASLDLEPATANGADSAVAGGTVNMGMDNVGNFTGQVNFSGTGTLTMGGQVYTVIDSLGTATSSGDGTLQGMQGNLAGHYALGNNIDASGTSTWNSGAGFTPIGASSSFTGTFDGLGHTISGLSITQSNYTPTGLFGTVEGSSGAPVFLRNVGLTNLSVSCYAPCGGLVGYGEYYTTIQNVSVSGSLIGDGYGGGELEDAGMIVGYLESYHTGSPPYDSKIVNVNSSGTIFANEPEYVGGIAGEVYGVSMSGMHSSVNMTFQPGNYEDGQYLGGLVGEVDYGSISASTFTGTINLKSSATGTSNTAEYEAVGGLVGEFDSNDAISNSHFSGSILGTCPVGTCNNGDEYIGGLAGENEGIITSSYASGVITLTKSDNENVGGLVGDSGDAPISNSYSTVTITAPGSYNRNFGGFIGDFDGQPITNSYSTGSVTVGANAQSIGGFVGYANCCQNISVVYSTGAVTAGANSTQVGGFAGYLDNTNLSNAYSTGAVSAGAGSSQVAAFVGEAGGALVLTNTYASGATVAGSGSTSVGGLIGQDDGGNTVSASFWDKTSTGQPTSALGVGMTTAQLQQQVNLTSATAANGSVNPAWDFSSTWVMYNGNTYPLLQAFMTPLTVTGTIAQTYNGAAFAPTIAALTYSVTPDMSNLFGNVTVTGSAVGAVHAGTYTYTPGGLYSDQQGYIIEPYVAGTLTINPAPLTVTGTMASKVYNGTTVAPLSGGSLVGVFGGDTVTLAQAGSFASKNAGMGIAVSANDSIGGAAASDYTLIEPTGLTGTITPASLTVTGTTVANSVYNGTTAASLTGGSLVGVIGGDTVTLAQAGSFVSKNAGTGIAVAATDTLSGASASDYSITQPVGLTGTITPASLTVTGTTVANSVYNGTTAASLTGGSLVGVIGGDTVTLAQAGSFVSKNAGTGIAVAATDTLSGASASDYSITQPVGLTGTITPDYLSVTGTTVGSKVYNGTSSAPLTGGTLVGVVPGDSVTLVQTGTFASTNAGSGIAVTVTDSLSGANAGDYSITEPTGLRGTISPATPAPAAQSPLVRVAQAASTQVQSSFASPQLGSSPQAINAWPTIVAINVPGGEATASSATDISAGSNGSSSNEGASTTGDASTAPPENQKVVAVNVSMKIGATGTLTIESGGLRLPSNLTVDNQ